MRTSNPALSEQTFRGQFASLGQTTLGKTMTLAGTINKTGILLLCTLATATWTWRLFMQSHSAAISPGP
jgi:uncharacterized YccA/Bax inhibitor family protein